MVQCELILVLYVFAGDLQILRKNKIIYIHYIHVNLIQ